LLIINHYKSIGLSILFLETIYIIDNRELKYQIQENNKIHIDNVLEVLEQDPNLDICGDCERLGDYLWDLIDKVGSVKLGIIIALELSLSIWFCKP
jgi:hypothetical protein